MNFASTIASATSMIMEKHESIIKGTLRLFNVSMTLPRHEEIRELKNGFFRWTWPFPFDTPLDLTDAFELEKSQLTARIHQLMSENERLSQPHDSFPKWQMDDFAFEQEHRGVKVVGDASTTLLSPQPLNPRHSSNLSSDGDSTNYSSKDQNDSTDDEFHFSSTQTNATTSFFKTVTSPSITSTFPSITTITHLIAPITHSVTPNISTPQQIIPNLSDIQSSGKNARWMSTVKETNRQIQNVKAHSLNSNASLLDDKAHQNLHEFSSITNDLGSGEGGLDNGARCVAAGFNGDDPTQSTFDNSMEFIEGKGEDSKSNSLTQQPPQMKNPSTLSPTNSHHNTVKTSKASTSVSSIPYPSNNPNFHPISNSTNSTIRATSTKRKHNWYEIVNLLSHAIL